MAKESKQLSTERPKGTRDVFGSDYYQMQGLFEKAQEIALYYGFDPIDTPIIEHQDIWMRSTGESDLVTREMLTLSSRGGERLALRPERTTGVMRAYLEMNMKAWSQPIMLYHYGPTFRYDKISHGHYRQFHSFDLDIIGSDAPITDAIIIHTTLRILAEAGAQHLIVQINSIGDADSRKDHEKELRAFYKKNSAKLSASDREHIKTNVFAVLDSKDASTVELNQSAPKSMDFLSTSAKRHFKGVLEYLDQLNISYNINPILARGLEYYSHTIFEIHDTYINSETGQTESYALAGGGRYDYLAQSLGHKKEIPAVGVGIGIERVLHATWWKNLQPRIIKQPKVYFIQVGYEAKLRSLGVVEDLRKAKIPVMQALSRDKLSSQLISAEKSGAEFIIILGQREALDSTIIVRDVSTRSQKTIKMEHLIETLKKIK